MTIKRLLINTMMIGAVAMAPMTMSSCSDDDGGNGGPDIGDNSAEASTSGDVELDLNADGAPQVASQGGAITITWSADTSSVSVTVPENGTGNYNVGQDGIVNVTVGTSVWQGTGGSVEVTTNDENKIIGTLNDVELTEQNGDRTATLNGEFNASKDGGGSGSDNQITLTGAAEDTVSFGTATLETLDQPVNHKNIGLGNQEGSAATIQIVPADAPTGELDVVMQSNIGGDNTPDNYASMTVTYGGNTWLATGQGTVSLNTNDSSNVEGELTDVVLSPAQSEDEVTVRGTFTATN